MISFQKTLKSLTRFFQAEKIPYMIIGGIANSIYGEPRQTFDIDVKVKLPANLDLNGFVKRIDSLGKILSSKPLAFLKKTNVLPVEIEQIKVDIILAILPFEVEAMQRSRKIPFEGITIKICSPEDLIVQKAISEREKDWLDIEGICKNLTKKLDWNYILGHAQNLADWLDKPEILHKLAGLKDAK